VLSLIAAAAGAVIGALWDGTFGATLGAGVAWLLVRSLVQGRELDRLREALTATETSLLETRVSVARARAAAAAPPAPASAAAPLAAAAPASAVAPPAAPAPASAPPPVTVLRPRPASSDVGTPIAPRLPESTELPAVPPAGPFDTLLRWLLGGNTIVKVGIGILFVGLAFLAKYASERVDVPIEARLCAIGGAAIVLLAIGWRLRERRAGYAQTLQGGAVAILYLTLFAAFRLYGVLGVGPVFLLMVTTAVLAAVLAVLQDAPTLAVIGALGGFSTPLLVSTGSGNYVALFSYYLVLDLGIAIVAWHKTWRPLNLVGFLFTFVMGTAWGVLKYTDASYASSQAFLAAFFLLFVAVLLMPVRRQRIAPASRADGWVNGTLLFGLPTVTFALQYGLVRHTDYGVALSALALAVFYVMLAAAMRRHPRLAVVFEGSLAIGSVFVTLTIPFALDARSTAGAWALEGAGLVWLGFRQTRALGRAFGYLLLVVAGFLYFGTVVLHPTPDRLVDATLVNGLLVVASSIGAAWVVRTFAEVPGGHQAPADGIERAAESILIGWATLWLAFVAGVEIDAFVSWRFQIAAWVICASAAAGGYAGLSAWLRWPRIAIPVLGHAPVMIVGVLATAALLEGPLENRGWLAWPLALAIHLLALRLAAPAWTSRARHVAHALGGLVVAALGGLEGRAVTAHWGASGSAWPWLGFLAVPAGLLLALPLPSAARFWPVRAAPRAYQSGACAVLTLGLLMWGLCANVASTGSAEPLPYVPFLNPLDLGVGIALFAVWRWMASEGARSGPERLPRLVLAWIAADAFVWLNAMAIRGFHHYLGVPFRVDAWMASLAVQTGISLLWTVTALALMWTAARRAIRTPWVAGAVLLAAVVLKLIAVDLSGSGTVTRIVSFIGVGVGMLVIGYVAPLPGKGGAHELS